MAALQPEESASKEFLERQWDESVLRVMSEYIRIPNQSPDFDPEWATNGHMDRAMALLVDWVKEQKVRGLSLELIQDAGRTPFLFIEIEATGGAREKERTVLMYGHMDKQPPLRPWAEGLDPTEPVLRGDRLYGRGGADDGYAVCASVLSVAALQHCGVPHSRVCIVIEASEESCESDLEHYINKTKLRLGNVDLVVCLDSGALSFDRLWVTTSLRGVLSASLRVQLLEDSIHSGIGGGCVADSFRVQRALLERVEDSATGDIKLQEFHCDVPDGVLRHMGPVNALPRSEFVSQFPLLPGVAPEPGDNVELALRGWWKPALTVIGAEGLPHDLTAAGNVLRKSTTLKLSVRTPPLVKCASAATVLEETLCRDPPYGARVEVDVDDASDGWAAPELAPWLERSLEASSQAYFQKSFACIGLGGTIPFMAMLGDMFPAAQFVVTGVLGPQSNAHGPNEFLDLAFGKGINYCVSRVLADHVAA